MLRNKGVARGGANKGMVPTCPWKYCKPLVMRIPYGPFILWNFIFVAELGLDFELN
jgi:hypothetical protein